jgi:hypothetical protein
MIVAGELLPVGAVDRIGKITGIVGAERSARETP